MSAETQDEAQMASMIAKKPLGRFIIGHATFAHDWRSLLPLFARVVIVRAESLWSHQGIEYLGICDDFEPINQADPPPFYDVKYCNVEGEGEKFVFVKAEAT